MKKQLIIILLMFSFVTRSEAQELIAKLTINTQQVSSVDPNMISTLEGAINSLLNERKWSDATFTLSERIDCAINITVNSMPTINSFAGEIQITARRPVYNSTYVTTTLNFKDSQFDFSYTTGESLDYNSYNLSNNLVATIAFYSYIVVGLDFDSFSLNGGNPYFTRAMEIANAVQSQDLTGWKPFSGKMNRYDLAVALTDESSKDFHTAWYNYHREGLDIMESNPTRGRIRVLESVTELEKLHESRPSSPLLTVFAECKLDELVRISSQATSEEKKTIKKQLLKLFPVKSDIINTLK